MPPADLDSVVSLVPLGRAVPLTRAHEPSDHRPNHADRDHSPSPADSRAGRPHLAANAPELIVGYTSCSSRAGSPGVGEFVRGWGVGREPHRNRQVPSRARDALGVDCADRRRMARDCPKRNCAGRVRVGTGRTGRGRPAGSAPPAGLGIPRPARSSIATEDHGADLPDSDAGQHCAKAP